MVYYDPGSITGQAEMDTYGMMTSMVLMPMMMVHLFHPVQPRIPTRHDALLRSCYCG